MKSFYDAFQTPIARTIAYYCNNPIRRTIFRTHFVSGSACRIAITFANVLPISLLICTVRNPIYLLLQ